MRASAAVGRVGGLAVALGIGAAVTVGCAGAAWADSTDPSSSATAPAVHRATVSSHSRRPAAAPERMASQSVSTATPAPAAARRQAARVAGATAKATAAANNANSFASTFFNQTPTLSLAGNPVQGANGVVTGMLNGTDAEGDPLTYSVTAAPSNGTVAVGTNGSYTYTPSESVAYAGTIDSFAVTVSDAGAGFHIHGIMGLLNLLTFGLLGFSGHTSTVTVPVNVSAWKRYNTAPTATVTVGAPNPTTGVVLGRVVATDAESDPLSYSTTSSPAKGAVAVAANGSFTYTPTATARHGAASNSATAADQTDTFTITVSDGQGGTTDVPVSVAIQPKNSAPVAGTTVMGTPNPSTGVVTGSVSATDAELDPLTYSAPGSTTKGTVTVDAGSGAFTYTPNAFGVTASTDTFTVTVTDGYGGSTPVAVSVPIRAATASNARVTYVFSYTTGAQYWTADAKSALQSAADKIASYIVVSQPVTLTFEVTASNAPNSSNLASAGSDLGGVGSGYSYTVVQGKLLGGQDANGSQYDGSIDANFGQPWAFGNTVGSSQYDFVSTMMHEMLHAYGFLSYLDQAGYNTGRQWPVFDNAVSDQNGTLVINGSYRFNTAFNPNLTGGNGGLYFSGAHAVAAYGGLVPLYTPNPWEAGSSLSHLDDNTFTGANAQLMNAYADSGPGIRVLSPVEKGILQDLGYTLSPASIVVVGFFIRRRKVKT